MPATDASVGVEVAWPEGDKTMIQVDLSGICPQNTSCEVMSVYRYLMMLEKQKKVTKYDMSYTKCSRTPTSDGQLSDSFKIEIGDPHKFKTIPDLEKALSCKSFFHGLIGPAKDSEVIVTVFRWRFERIHSISKIQKPYVATRVALKLEPGKPVAL